MNAERKRHVIVGTYGIGLEQAQVVLREGYGGEFYFNPAKGAVPRIKIGAAGDWERVVSALLHEALEMEFTRLGMRYSPAPDFGADHSSYVFLMTHPLFSESVARVGGFLSTCLPELAIAYKKWNNKK